jgi:hypothetical protein
MWQLRLKRELSVALGAILRGKTKGALAAAVAAKTLRAGWFVGRLHRYANPSERRRHKRIPDPD